MLDYLVRSTPVYPVPPPRPVCHCEEALRRRGNLNPSVTLCLPHAIRAPYRHSREHGNPDSLTPVLWPYPDGHCPEVPFLSPGIVAGVSCRLPLAPFPAVKNAKKRETTALLTTTRYYYDGWQLMAASDRRPPSAPQNLRNGQQP